MEKSVFSVSKKASFLITIIMSFVGLICVVPYILAISISFTSQEQLDLGGYSLIPADFNLGAYTYLFSGTTSILHAYWITIIVTVVGTLLVLLVTLTLGYVLSRKTFAFKSQLTLFIFITMLFNAGLTANYMIMTQYLHLYDTIWALILPLIVNPFWIFMARTFFAQTVPDAIIESATIDGASEFTIFRKIVLPISLPVTATIGLFSTLAYWNDWFNAKLYIESSNLDTLQYLLVRMEQNADYLKQNAATIGAAASEVANTVPSDALMMATMVIATLPLVVAYPFFQKYFVSGLTIGAVK